MDFRSFINYAIYYVYKLINKHNKFKDFIILYYLKKHTIHLMDMQSAS